MARNVSRHGIPKINETLRRQCDSTERTNGGRKVRSLVRSLRIRRYTNSVFDHKRRRCVGRRALEVAAKHPTSRMVLVSKYTETRKSTKRFKTKERQRWRKDSFISDLTRLIFWVERQRTSSICESTIATLFLDVCPCGCRTGNLQRDLM